MPLFVMLSSKNASVAVELIFANWLANLLLDYLRDGNSGWHWCFLVHDLIFRHSNVQTEQVAWIKKVSLITSHCVSNCRL